MPARQAPNTRTGFRNSNAAVLRNAQTQGQYYAAGGRSAFGGGTIRRVDPGGRTTVVGGTARS